MVGMQIQSVGTVFLTPQPQQHAEFYVTHFGFTYAAKMDWYVSLQHPDLSDFFLDLMDGNHPATPATLHGQTATPFLAFIVSDAQAEAKRLEGAGLTLLKPMTDEPWGQRRFQVAGPNGAVIEIVQRIAPDAAWLKENMPS